MGTCFVCMVEDGRPLYRVCKCQSCVHEECARRLVMDVPSHTTHCAVCRSKYDVVVEHGLRSRFDWPFVGFFSLSTSAFVVACGGIVYFHTKRPPLSLAILVTLYLAMVVSLCTCVVVGALYARHNGCCVSIERAPIRKTLVLPPPVVVVAVDSRLGDHGAV